MDYKNNIFGRYLNGLSQFAHWFIGASNTDISMSAKVGWKATEGNKWFQFVQKVIDTTFYPIDGSNHCYHAYITDEEDYTIGDHLWCGIVISIISLIGCLTLAPIFWIYQLFRK